MGSEDRNSNNSQNLYIMVESKNLKLSVLRGNFFFNSVGID